MTDSVLEVKNLVKEFGSFRAVNGISFVVPKGKVLGFLGPNGAGKTTTIHMLLGITTPTSGSISYFGKDFSSHKQEILKKINFTSAFNTLQGRITVWENLIVFALMYGVKNYKKKTLELLEYFEITDLINHRYMDLSAGQKTRVNLIKSLINDPEVVLMDEATASLDPDIADKTLTLIEKLKKERELTILYTSHDMDEITRICDEVIFLDHGKIVAQDTPLGLTKRVKVAKLKIIFDANKPVVEKFLKAQKQDYTFVDDHKVIIKTEESLIPKVIFGISEAGIWITDIEVEKPTLEDVFLQIARGDNYVA